MNYYKRHLGDYARDTGHLTMLEHGAYGLLLDRYYATECGIPAADAYRICRARSVAERKAVDAVLAEFYERVGEFWTHGKCDEVIAEHREQADTNRRIAVEREATKRARTVLPSCNESLPEREPSHKPLATSQEKERARKRASRLPKPFELTPDWRETGRVVAEGLGFLLNIENEWAKFCDHWWAQAGAKGVKDDWAATWRNWIRKSCEYAPKEARSAPPAKPRPPSCVRCPKDSTRRIEGVSYCDDHGPIQPSTKSLAEHRLAAEKRAA